MEFITQTLQKLNFCEAFHSLINYITITISFPHNTVSIRYSLSRYKINLRENQRSNQEWTIQRHRQHWAQDTGRRQTKYKHNIEN